jgi:hypothetical protein
MGASKPTVEVVNAGAGVNGICQDLDLTSTDSLIKVYRDDRAASHPELTLISSSSLEGILQPGDRIEVVDIDATVSQTYTVTKTGMSTNIAGDTFMIDYPITWVAGSGGEELEVRIIHGGVPQFSVKHEIQGEDSYTYDIIFTGKHLGNVAAVTATNAGCTFSQFGGMTFGLDTEVTQEGGSMQQLVIELSSSTAMPLDTKYKYFKLAYLPTDAVSDGLSYGHGDQLTNLETFFDATYAAGTFSTDYILKSGNGTAEEGFGFQYTVTFQDGLGSMQVPFLLQDG